ncbi:MAG: hypothetical protein ABIS14_10170, partial [Sphingomonas sp.]
MNGGSRIVNLRIGRAPPTEEEVSLPESPPVDETIYQGPDTADYVAPTRGGWVLPMLALVVAAGWVGGMLWLAWPTLPGIAPIALTEFVAALCVPPALIAILLLLVMRSSKAEARRFGNVALAMRREAASLEHTVTALSQTIDTQRARLAEQTATLADLGDGASHQLATIGSDMAEQIAVAGEHAAALTEAANGAHARLGILLALLPKAQGEAAGMAERLEAAGISASEHAAALHAQLAALAERGHQADQVSGDAAQKLAAHIARMEATSETAGARLESVTAEMSTAVDGLLGRTAGAIDEARRGITAQGEAMLAMLGTNQAALERTGHESAAALAERIAAIEALIDRIAARLDEQRGSGDTIIATLGGGIDDVSQRLDVLHAQG